jgi:probable F420-dependent oxidoreductase
MKFALQGFGLAPRHWPEVAAAAEANGFESVLVPEHLVFPAEMPALYSYNQETGLPPMTSDAPAYDPWVLLASMAAVTSTIRLGTCVFILPLRHPIAVARSLVTLDRLTGGRIIAGVGAGWLIDEFEIIGLSYTDRGARMDESMDLMRRLFGPDEIIEHHGRHFDLGQPIVFNPKPLGTIPLHVGGTSPAALRRAARRGDGWMSHGPLRAQPPTAEQIASDLAALRDNIAIIDREREEAGRSAVPFEVTAGFGATLHGARAAEEAGVHRYACGPGPMGKPGFLDWIKRFADDVIAVTSNNRLG